MQQEFAIWQFIILVNVWHYNSDFQISQPFISFVLLGEGRDNLVKGFEIVEPVKNNHFS